MDQMILEVFSNLIVSMLLCYTDEWLEPELEKVMWNKVDKAAICKVLQFCHLT